MTDEEFEERAFKLKQQLKHLTQLHELCIYPEEAEKIYKKLEVCMDEYSDMVDDMEFDDHIDKLSENEELIER